MIITKTKTLKEVKEIFNFIFPVLRIEFYKSRFNPFQPSPPKLDYDGDIVIADVNPSINGSDLQLDLSSTIEQVVYEFESKFGLHVQIFRKSNNMRFHPSFKNSWSLETFNNLK